MPNNILVTGGAGYVGSKLVPLLLAQGNKVTVLDTYWYGDVFADLKDDTGLRQVQGDIRDVVLMKETMRGQDRVIHLACISNDPSFELNPILGKSINLDAFPPLVTAAREAGVGQFVNASSSSIYGVQDVPDVVEDTPPKPLTDYSKFKLACEQLLPELAGEMAFTSIRPATVCGYAPRLRLDVVINLLTIHALEKEVLTVLGGPQKRPNIHIDDMVRAYERVLDFPLALSNGQAFNVGSQNYTVENIARTVLRVVGKNMIEFKPTNDTRSYHINSEKIERVLGFRPRRTIEDAVRSIVDAYKAGKIERGLENPLYWNIKQMQRLGIQ